MLFDDSNPSSARCNESTLYKHGIFRSLRLILGWFVAILLVGRWQSVQDFGVVSNVIQTRTRGDPTTSAHTLPTILSVVDPISGNYLNALENPLYEILKARDVVLDHENAENKENGIHLEWDRTHIHARDSVKIRWADTKGIVTDNDILVLVCDDEILEIATIAQARATSQRHSPHGIESVRDENNSWYFPSFPILRRDTCQFSLYDKAPSRQKKGTAAIYQYDHLATSNDLYLVDAHKTPTAIHIAFGDTLDEMVVQFTTGYLNGTPVVQYGIDSLDHTAKGQSHTYTNEDMCQEPATRREPGKYQPPGIMHVVRLQELAPNMTYQYRVGLEEAAQDDNQEFHQEITWSDTYSFQSAPVVAGDSPPFSFLVYGDQGCPALGWGDGGVWTSAMAARELHGSRPIRAVHHFGDLSYAVGVAHVWDEWFHMISSFTPHVPLMIGVGNHEYDHTEGGSGGKDPSGVNSSAGYHPYWGNFGHDSFGECGVPTANQFTMPRSKGSNGVFWYSYNMANVHTIMLSSEHDLAPGSIQHLWLEQDLKSVDRSLLPWVILEIHRPFYEAELDTKDYRVGVELRVELEELLLKYNVDLVLGGHYHAYLRTCQGLYKNKCNNGGPLHITVGSAGARMENNTVFDTVWTKKYIPGVYGYGRVTVENATAMHFEFVQAGRNFEPWAGHVLDDAWLTKIAHDTKATRHVGTGGASVTN
ncbi:Probable inactive purple acid phosphatase [Seminavis robusta]|uniref:Purple acid phosphatase n=1 Tax=Seminavis robusta TaxID=568900 RepID=A0A9N8DYD4_9STRA|nr:Probable inactive purple acid phosphatase [Seminavis robusta]|eukprot:Sro444_g144340.1 Probable inactive purple acid phosphatase (704) ;mRNA; r:37860-39971